MSGNKESDYHKAIGHGMGSVGMQLWFQCTASGWLTTGNTLSTCLYIYLYVSINVESF